MKNIKPNRSLIILALNTEGNHTFEKYILQAAGLTYIKPLWGSYQGQKERSHLIEFENLEQLRAALAVAKQYNQDSVLVLDTERKAELFYLDGRIEPIGKFVSTCKCKAETSEGYTHDHINDRYFICQ